METTTYKFSEFTRTMVKKAFQLKQVEEKPKLMEGWLQKANEQKINQVESMILPIIHEELIARNETWNEEELQAGFIFPLLSILQFTNRTLEIAAFTERLLKIQIQTTILQGRVDWMAAAGLHEPEQPFFFIHEYKKGIGGSGDPVGQLLITMFVAQHLNAHPKKPTLFDPTPKTYDNLPIYGCYVVGKIWKFVILKEKEYYISKDYNATKTNELHEIVKLLKAQKQLIIERVTQN